MGNTYSEGSGYLKRLHAVALINIHSILLAMYFATYDDVPRISELLFWLDPE
jgi:hypothetical protein